MAKKVQGGCLEQKEIKEDQQEDVWMIFRKQEGLTGRQNKEQIETDVRETITQKWSEWLRMMIMSPRPNLCAFCFAVEQNLALINSSKL